VRNLVNRFGDHTVHDGVNLTIYEQEILGIVGGSGSGKSVLLRTMLGLHTPSEGEVLVFGSDITCKKSGGNSLSFCQNRWGVLFQSGALFSGLTVLENVVAPIIENTRISKSFAAELGRLKLKRVGLSEAAVDKYPSELSGGMKRRVLIAKALSHEPTVLFLDEPTAGVDVNLRKDMWQIVSELKAAGVTIILTTHYIEEAEAIADRIGVINNGELILVEEKQALMTKLGRKQLLLDLLEPLTEIPASLADFELELSDGGHKLIYTFNTRGQHTGITSLLDELRTANIRFQDINTTQRSLEDIFVNLVEESTEATP